MTLIRNLMEVLADCYFTKRVSPGWFRPGRERLDFLVKLTKDFLVDGAIWYHLMYGLPAGHSLDTLQALRVGALAKGIIPIPDMVFLSSYFCDMGSMTEELLCERYG